MPQTVQASGRTAHTGSVSSSLTRAVHVVSVSLTEGAVPVPRVLYSVYTASSMCRRTATTCSLLVVAAAALLILPLLGNCAAVSAQRLPRRHAPAVLLLGGVAGAGAWERGGRTSPAQGSPREGRELAARRLGKRAPSLETPPSPKPHGMTGMVMPLPPPPPPYE